MMRPRTGGLRTFALLSAFALAAVAACDSLTGPSVPDVAGTYTGPLTVEATAVGIGTVTVTGSMRMVAEQNRDSVTISGSFTVEGDTETIDAVPGTIDETGLWTQAANVSGGFLVEGGGCGYTGESRVRFSGGSLLIEISARTPIPTIDCPNINSSADLART